MTPDTAKDIGEVAIKANTANQLLKHIAERRIEYLLGTLIAYQLGLLDKVVTYGSGVCA
jgi:hypothetical protein